MHEAQKGLTGDPRNAHMSNFPPGSAKGLTGVRTGLLVNFPHMGSAKGLAGLRTGDHGVRTTIMLNQKSIWGVNVLNVIFELGVGFGKSSSVQPTFMRLSNRCVHQYPTQTPGILGILSGVILPAHL